MIVYYKTEHVNNIRRIIQRIVQWIVQRVFTRKLCALHCLQRVL